MPSTKSTNERFSKIEKRLEKLEKSFTSPSPRTKIKKKTKKSLVDEILELISEGFFDTPKNVIEIYAHLKTKAVFYPKNSYPESLLRLIKKRELRRLKENKIWVYVKYG